MDSPPDWPGLGEIAVAARFRRRTRWLRRSRSFEIIEDLLETAERSNEPLPFRDAVHANRNRVWSALIHFGFCCYVTLLDL